MSESKIYENIRKISPNHDIKILAKTIEILASQKKKFKKYFLVKLIQIDSVEVVYPLEI